MESIEAAGNENIMFSTTTIALLMFSSGDDAVGYKVEGFNDRVKRMRLCKDPHKVDCVVTDTTCPT